MSFKDLNSFHQKNNSACACVCVCVTRRGEVSWGNCKNIIFLLLSVSFTSHSVLFQDKTTMQSFSVRGGSLLSINQPLMILLAASWGGWRSAAERRWQRTDPPQSPPFCQSSFVHETVARLSITLVSWVITPPQCPKDLISDCLLTVSLSMRSNSFKIQFKHQFKWSITQNHFQALLYGLTMWQDG